MISPKSSQAFGLAVSVVTGLAVFGVVWVLFVWKLNFWYLDEVLGPVLGFVGGCLSAYALYTTGMRETPLNWVGVGLFLGKPNGDIYENGINWISPFHGIRNVPARTEKFILQMPGEMIDAQDGIAIFFGISESEHPGKHNRLQYSVIYPTRYIATDDPEDALREEYIQAARLFFGQVAKAIGVKNEKLLFSDYLTLPPKAEPDPQGKHAAFRTRLKDARFVTTLQTAAKKTNGVQQPQVEPLFSDASVIVIMEKAGDFLEMVANWGLGDITAFTANVRENPEAEVAAAKKAEAIENMATLDTKAKKIKELAKQMALGGVSPDLALTMVAKISGQSVDIENKTVTYSGLPEVLRELGTLAINRLAKPQRRAPAKKRTIKSKGGK